MHINIDEDDDYLQGNDNATSDDLWLDFLISFLYFKVFLIKVVI